MMSQDVLRKESFNQVKSESALESQKPPSFLTCSEGNSDTERGALTHETPAEGKAGRAGGGALTFAAAAVRDLQLRVLALGTLELAAGQEGPSVRRTERLLGGPPAVQAAVFVLILIDSQKLQGGTEKKPDKFTDTFCRAAVTGSPPRPLSVGRGLRPAAAGEPLSSRGHRPRRGPGHRYLPNLGRALTGGHADPGVAAAGGLRSALPSAPKA